MRDLVKRLRKNDAKAQVSTSQKPPYSIQGEAADEIERLSITRPEALRAPTADEISAYRDTFRAELDKRMDTAYPSASPSTESHAVALRRFVENRNER